jgi:hypothetical protein
VKNAGSLVSFGAIFATPSMPTFHLDKICNAYVPDVLGSPATKPDERAALLRQYRDQFAGLWVGGRVAVTPEWLSYHPNQRTKRLHADLREIHIPFADIRSVRREFGWVSGIVVVEHAGGLFRFRCFGARSVAARLARHLGLN